MWHGYKTIKLVNTTLRLGFLKTELVYFRIRQKNGHDNMKDNWMVYELSCPHRMAGFESESDIEIWYSQNINFSIFWNLFLWWKTS